MKVSRGMTENVLKGKIHRYYQCHASKKLKICEKKGTSKTLAESLVIDYILRLLNDIKSVMNKKENPDNNNGFQGSPLGDFGDPNALVSEPSLGGSPP